MLCAGARSELQMLMFDQTADQTGVSLAKRQSALDVDDSVGDAEDDDLLDLLDSVS